MYKREPVTVFWFPCVLGGEYYGEVYILILKASTAGCSRWFMTYFVIIQWVGEFWVELEGGGATTTAKASRRCCILFSQVSEWVSVVHQRRIISPPRRGVGRHSWKATQLPGAGRNGPALWVGRRMRGWEEEHALVCSSVPPPAAVSRWQTRWAVMTLWRMFPCEGQSAPRNTCIITDKRIFPSLPKTNYCCRPPDPDRLFHGFSRVPDKAVAFSICSPCHMEASLSDSSRAFQLEETGRCLRPQKLFHISFTIICLSRDHCESIIVLKSFSVVREGRNALCSEHIVWHWWQMTWYLYLFPVLNTIVYFEW